MVVFDFLFVLGDLAIQFIGQRIQRGVHVVVHRLGMQIGAVDIQAAFGAFFLFLHPECNVDGHHFVEMTFKALKFVMDVVTDGVGDFKVATDNNALHTVFLTE